MRRRLEREKGGEGLCHASIPKVSQCGDGWKGKKGERAYATPQFRSFVCRAASTSQQTWLKPRLLGTEEILQKLLGFVWSHWDHPVEVGGSVGRSLLMLLQTAREELLDNPRLPASRCGLAIFSVERVSGISDPLLYPSGTTPH